MSGNVVDIFLVALRIAMEGCDLGNLGWRQLLRESKTIYKRRQILSTLDDNRLAFGCSHIVR